MQSHATDHQNETKQSEYKKISSQFSMLYSLPSEHLTILTYEDIIDVLAPRFKPYVVTELHTKVGDIIPIRSEAPLDKGIAYKVKLKEDIAHCLHGVGIVKMSSKIDSFHLMTPVAISFPPLHYKLPCSPTTFAEALFVTGHEMAHVVCSHAVETIHRTELASRLIYDYRWYLKFLGFSANELWNKEYASNELQADSLSVKVGGIEALRGGITLFARDTIERKRRPFCMTPLIDPLLNEEDRLINLLRMWKSFSSSLESTSDYANDYYHLIDAMPDWQEAPNCRDSSTKKELHDLVKKAENASLKIGGSNSFFSKSMASSAAAGVTIGLALCTLANILK